MTMPSLALPLAAGAYSGELAALGTAVCWTASALAFTAAARRLGVLSLNLIRLGMALLFAAVLMGIVRGLPLPTDATGREWFWLSLSGLVGLVFGDLCLFQALVVLGPRRTMLTFSLAPILAALLGWLVLGEALGPKAWIGMALVIGGVALVILEKPPEAAPGSDSASGRVTLEGALLALGAALGQAAGMVLAKIGMAGTYDVFAATQIRMIAGIAAFALLVMVLGRGRRFVEALRHRAGLGFAAVGAFFGSFVGVSLSLIAVKYAQVGVATTIISIVPVLIIPAVVVLYKERVTLRAVLGACAAVAGVALLFIRASNG